MPMDYQTHQQFNQQMGNLAVHPSGPELKGQPRCQSGFIWDHKANRCISLVEYMRMQKQNSMANV